MTFLVSMMYGIFRDFAAGNRLARSAGRTGHHSCLDRTKTTKAALAAKGIRNGSSPVVPAGTATPFRTQAEQWDARFLPDTRQMRVVQFSHSTFFRMYVFKGGVAEEI